MKKKAISLLTAFITAISCTATMLPTLNGAGTAIAASTSDAKFNEAEFYVVVGTYGGATQLRYFVQKSDGSYSAEKVVWEDAPEELSYGDVLLAEGKVIMEQVRPASDPVYAMAYYYKFDDSAKLTKVGSCSQLMEKKDLTVERVTYDGSAHWSINYTDESGEEYYYGLSTYGSSLGVDPTGGKEGDIYTFAAIDGNIVVPLAKKGAESDVKVVDNAVTTNTTATTVTETTTTTTTTSTKHIENDPTILNGTKEMNLDDVKEIAKKKTKITWSDFADFKGELEGTGRYTIMCRFELEDGYYLIVEGNPPEAPEIIRLYHKGDSDFIDLRYHNVEQYIDNQFYKELKNMSEEEIKALFNEKGMTEEKGYRAWTKETASKALDNYFLTFLVKLPASFTDSKGNTIINETTDIKELSKMADDNSFEEQSTNFLLSFKVNITSQFAISGHFVYRSESSGDEKVYRRYIVFNVNRMAGRSFTRDETNQMLAGALNYIQFRPQFAGFEYDSRIPRYSDEDTGKLKGDANNDGQVDMADVVFIMQCLANPDKYELTAEGRANADIDGDGVTVGDAQHIQKRLLGIIDYITDLDTIRTMLSDYTADQMIHITVVPREKMPEQFADKYVFVRRNTTNSDGLSFDDFLRKHYIDQSLIRNIPYDIDDDSELNKLCENLYLYAFENNIAVGVYKYEDKVILVYDFRNKDDNEKMEKYIKDNNIDPNMIMKEVLE